MPRNVPAVRAMLVVAAIALAGCGRHRASQGSDTGRALRVGVLFDIGGRGDGGFNDGAAAGAERARDDGPLTLDFAEAGSGGGRAEALRRLASQKPDLVIAIGFLASGDATTVAREFPDVHFAVIDYSLPLDKDGRAMDPPPNLAGVNFREEEGSYLVGALAALNSHTHRVGFVGGMDSPLIHKFEAGFDAGVHRVCKSCTVESRYVGTTPSAFSDPEAGHRIAAALYASGADVVYQASGGSGAGVMAAAREANRQVIGVDVDQWSMAPGLVLTSMVKRIDVAVHDAISRERRGAFVPGTSSLGLAENGVGYVLDAHNTPLMSSDARERVETLRAAIVAGLLSVPTVR